MFLSLSNPGEEIVKGSINLLHKMDGSGLECGTTSEQETKGNE